jgi:hypothetical protein
MGMHGRFYVPALPLLILASANATSEPGEGSGIARFDAMACAAFIALLAYLHLADGLPSAKAFELDGVPSFLDKSLAIGGVAVLLSRGWPRPGRMVGAGLLSVTIAGSAALWPTQGIRLRSDGEYLALQESRYTVYRGLETLRACFGRDIHVYHSEVGLPGLRFQNGKVTDLAGLLSPAWLFRAKPFSELCEAEEPEAIFLPHRNYRALNREILSSRCLTGYRRVVTDSSSPLYVRNDLARRFRSCARARHDPFVEMR